MLIGWSSGSLRHFAVLASRNASFRSALSLRHVECSADGGEDLLHAFSREGDDFAIECCLSNREDVIERHRAYAWHTLIRGQNDFGWDISNGPSERRDRHIGEGLNCSISGQDRYGAAPDRFGKIGPPNFSLFRTRQD